MNTLILYNLLYKVLNIKQNIRSWNNYN